MGSLPRAAPQTATACLSLPLPHEDVLAIWQPFGAQAGRVQVGVGMRADAGKNLLAAARAAVIHRDAQRAILRVERRIQHLPVVRAETPWNRREHKQQRHAGDAGQHDMKGAICFHKSKIGMVLSWLHRLTLIPNHGQMGIEKIVGNIEKSDAGRDNQRCRDSFGGTILAKKAPGISGRTAEMPGGIVMDD